MDSHSKFLPKMKNYMVNCVLSSLEWIQVRGVEEWCCHCLPHDLCLVLVFCMNIACNTVQIAVAFKSREDHRKQMELEEARKAGLAPAEVDEDGKEINPHIPQYMSSAPWYLNAERPVCCLTLLVLLYLFIFFFF